MGNNVVEGKKKRKREGGDEGEGCRRRKKRKKNQHLPSSTLSSLLCDARINKLIERKGRKVDR